MEPSRFKVIRVKYIQNMWVGLLNHFDISMVFKISEFEVPVLNFNCIYKILPW